MTPSESSPATGVPSERSAGRGVTTGRVALVLAVSLLILGGGLLFALMIGDTAVDFSEALKFDPESLDYQKVFRHRLPRALAAVVVGGALAASVA